MNLVGGLDEATALETLEHADPYVRLWTVRLLCDAGQVSPARGREAGRPGRGRARRRGPQPARLLGEAAAGAQTPCRSSRGLLAHDEDASDIHMPLLLWWAIEAKVATDPEAVLALFREPRRLGPADRAGARSRSG